MAGGIANPAIVDALAAFGDEWWNSIIMPYTDTANLNALEQEMLMAAAIQGQKALNPKKLIKPPRTVAAQQRSVEVTL